MSYGRQAPAHGVRTGGGVTDDTEAVSRALRGDLDAYATLVTRYSALARRTAVLAGAGADADDIVQDAFVKGFRKLGTFRGETFRPWLLRIVVNETKNHHRGSARREAMLLRCRPVPGADVVDPEADVVEIERRERLMAAVRVLPERDRMVVACRYFLDLSEAETAQVLGWPRGSVKSRLSRALTRLRDQLEPRPEVADA